MPLPEINNKDKSTFMQECVSMVVNEGTPQEQAVEMCLNKWREATDERLEPKPLSPLDKILKIKKAMEKIGCFIDESPLEEFISKIRIQKNASLENMAKDVVFLEALGNIIKLQTHDIKPTDEAQKILAFPKGTFYIEHLKDKLTFDDGFFNNVIENFNNENLSKPFIDKNHELKESFADILGFEKTPDGLLATIKLNELGIKVIKDRQFRYISPTFGELTDNLQQPHKNVLMSISLTNVPALHGSLPQIQEQLELERKPNIGGTRMTGLTLKLTELQKVVGLEQITSLQDETDTAAIMEVLGAIGEKVAEIQELLVQVQGEKETAEKVAEEAEQQLETIRKADAEKEKERFFEKLVKEEKIDMSELEMWKEHYDSNKDFTIKMLSNRTGKITQLSSANTNNVSLTQKLDEDDIQALQNMGIDRNDTEKVKEYLAAQKNY